MLISKMMTVGVGHSRKYCNTGYDQSQGPRPSNSSALAQSPRGDIEPIHPSEINPNSDSRSRSDGRSRRYVQYRVEQSQGQRPGSPPPLYLDIWWVSMVTQTINKVKRVCQYEGKSLSDIEK